ncbi:MULTISPECIES: ABC transporter permease [Actinomycetes]|uniref:Transport permease protein n=2 Tax=Actinomycetes TaxID=1760 RepID=A0ABP6M2E4_9MICC
MATPTAERSAAPTHVDEPRQAGHVVQLDGSSLVRVGARPRLLDYIQRLWAFRHFIIYDSHSKVQTANSNDAMGRVWMVVNPILSGLAYFLVFGLLLDLSRGISNFIGYLIIGVFMFRYTTSAVSSGASSMVSNQSVVQAFNFPRASLPFAINVRELFANVPMLIVMALLVITIGDIPLADTPPTPVSVDWLWLFIFPVLALNFLLSTGLGMLLARAVSAYTDVKHMISFGMRIWFYTSAVFFTVDRFAGSPGGEYIEFVMYHNPMFCVLDIIRSTWLYGEMADPYRWVVLTVSSVSIFIIGFLVFWHGEEKYGRER